jgi:hypothetical protein
MLLNNGGIRYRGIDRCRNSGVGRLWCGALSAFAGDGGYPGAK